MRFQASVRLWVSTVRKVSRINLLWRLCLNCFAYSAESLRQEGELVGVSWSCLSMLMFIVMHQADKTGEICAGIEEETCPEMIVVTEKV